jgi:hypothetical protein
LWGKTFSPYIYEDARLIDGYPIAKKYKSFTFYLQTLTSLFSNPNFLSPFIPVMLGGESSWPADARSTHDTFSLTGSLSGRRFLVQAMYVAHWSD